jgi:tetratricopeptide (TPR) repeat protein
MAEVYLARAYGAQGIEKQLVIKRILPAYVRDAHFITMFVDEALVASKLNHTNIVQIYSFEQIGRDYVLAMEYMDGPDLTKLMVATRRQGRFVPPPLAALVVHEVARGLDYAHNRRDEHGEPLEIVHRDVSPQNILLSYDGAVKVADFGIARARQLGEEASGIIKGKFAYMSPEQAEGVNVDRRSDIFSLGLVMFELLAGRPLHRGKPGSGMLKRILNPEVPPLAELTDHDVPEPLDAILRKALAREPTGRYQTARAMAVELARYLHSLPEIVDANTLEAYLNDVLPRDEGTQASPPPKELPAPKSEVQLPTVAFKNGRRPRQTREKVNIVAVAGRLHGVDTLSRAIGERRASARVREFLRIVEEISFKCDGIVARQDERGFLLYLGLPLSSVDDPVRAVRLGLDVLDAAEGLSYDLPCALHLGLGINRGAARVERDTEGRVQDYEPYALLTTLADRLSDDSGPGEIRVGGGVYRLSRRDFNFEELPTLELSVSSAGGTQVSEPQGNDTLRRARVFRLLGAKTRAERRLEAGAEGRLLGRELEIQNLRDAYRETVSASQSRFVWVQGDMGIGKTRLVNELLARTKTSSRRVVRADCTLATRDLSFGAVADLIRDACGISEDDRSEAARTKLQVTLSRLWSDADGDDVAAMGERITAAFCLLLGIPLPDAGANPEDSAEREELIREGVLRLTRRLGRSEPLVLAVDNVHFADTASLELFQWLAQRAQQGPLIAFMVGRPEERLNRHFSSFHKLTLRQLGDEDRLRLVFERLGEGDEAKELARQICARTGGNPFFIHEVIEALIDRGVVRFDGPERRLRIDRRGPIRIPTTLDGAIAARIEELPPDERLLLRWAAVAGLSFNTQLLSTLAGGDISEPLERLVRRRILVERPATRPEAMGEPTNSGDAESGKEEGRTIVGFRYPVMREVAYEGLVGADRLQMHKRMASLLTSDMGTEAGPRSSKIAFHLERAGDQDGAATHYLEAAEVAREGYSNREALRYYARAIMLLPPDTRERFRAHESREQILRGLGRFREQMAELDQMRRIAQSIADPGLVALSYNRLARLYLDLGRLSLASKALTVALESVRGGVDSGAEVESLRLLSVLALNEGHYLRALECCDQALTLVGCATGALKQRGTILLSRGDVLRQMGRLRDAVRPYAEALVIYRRLGIKRLQAHTLNSMGIVARSLGEYEDALGLLRRSLKLEQQINDRFRVGRKLCHLGLTYAEVGDLERALYHLRQAAQVSHQLRDRSGMEETLTGLAEVLLAAGAQEEVTSTLDKAARVRGDGGSRSVLVRCALVQTDLALAAEDWAAAVPHGAEAERLAKEAGMPLAEVQALARLALAYARQDRTDEAKAVLARLDSLRRDLGDLERAEKVLLLCAQACDALDMTDQAWSFFEKAHAVVEERVEKIQSAELRQKYQSAPQVAAVQQGFRRLAAAKALGDSGESDS